MPGELRDDAGRPVLRTGRDGRVQVGEEVGVLGRDAGPGRPGGRFGGADGAVPDRPPQGRAEYLGDWPEERLRAGTAALVRSVLSGGGPPG
ncbi:hypothetical protein J0910_08220 [Nocardiopsis sp. CNT-189]|uniref:hypothetical protein n=1 Tax=Nocardiopsis oceanisediminis TaxID=2816862 RepID=UPI003B31EE71